MEAPGGFVLLKRLRPLPYPDPEPSKILSAAHLCLNRLLSIQAADGTVGYLYSPFKDKWADATNCVRQAGCAYAMARAADHSAANPEVQPIHDAASQILHSLVTSAVSWGPKNGLFIPELNADEPWGKLGATALTALASQYSVGESCSDESAAMVRTILELQNPDGSFICGIGRDEGASAQDYFPGESLLALARYAHRTGDERASAALSKSFPYYRAHFRNRPASAFVLWQTDTWTRVASWLIDGSFPPTGAKGLNVDELCAFVFEQVDWLLSYQYTKEMGSPPEYIGGFQGSSPSNLQFSDLCRGNYPGVRCGPYDREQPAA